jgi:37-kD nucleoid-associated bacterial protein
MIDYTNSTIENISTHWVGNKQEGELHLSKQKVEINGEVLPNALKRYFFNSFKTEEYYNFYHDSDLKYNEVYGIVSDIFANPTNLHELSIALAKHLYQQSVHPKIKGGEFYVVYFTGCIYAGEAVDAVGIFKSENKDTFLRVLPNGERFEIESEQGINVNKLDKGALIINSDCAQGYIVAIVDNTNKGEEAHYWVDDFLHVQQRKDEYYNTRNAMSLCKNFVTKELPAQFTVSKADQAELLNKSVQFFKEKEQFDMSEFAQQVIAQPEVIESFNQYKTTYAQERDIEFPDNFDISDSAVRKQARILKSVIKLDKNFHIYVHGNNQYIKRGFDPETGMQFYQLFFKEEE